LLLSSFSLCPFPLLVPVLVGGLVLLLLAPMFFAGFHSVDADTNPDTFVAIWVVVMLLLGVNVLLAMVDVGLTWKIRRARLAALRANS
jgi:hypothetical protein